MHNDYNSSFPDCRDSLLDYKKWRDVNSDKTFSLFDYIHGVLVTKELSSDLALAFVKLCWPDFIVLDGLVFLREEFSEKRYRELIEEGFSGNDLEYWMNLLNIDRLINSQSDILALEFASSLMYIWNAKLQKDFPEKNFLFQCFQENSSVEQEVYIAFHQKHNE